MAEYELYCFAQSGNAYRAALMLNLIGADWQPRWVDFFVKGETRSPEYRTNVNEMGEVPVLAHGDRKISQSGVILTYLAERSGKFRPANEDERLETLRWIIFDNQKINGFLGPYRFLRVLARPAGDPAVLNFLKMRVTGNLAIVDKRLSERPFLLGERADHRGHFNGRLSVLSGRGIRLRHRRRLPRDRCLARTRQGLAGLEAPLRADAGASPAAAMTAWRPAEREISAGRIVRLGQFS